MARYRKERRARLNAERISRRRDKAWRKKVRRKHGICLPSDSGRHTLIGRITRWLLGGD